jgi:hypothetical protein
MAVKLKNMRATICLLKVQQLTPSAPWRAYARCRKNGDGHRHAKQKNKIKSSSLKINASSNVSIITNLGQSVDTHSHHFSTK